jgi:hypothetical protein
MLGVTRKHNLGKSLAMPVSLPFAASSGRDLSNKPRRIPKSVQLACLDMIHQGIDLVAAARANNLRPDTLRRHLHRVETLGFIRRERAALRAALCSSNEFYLASIRNSSQNEMARTKAIALLEQISDEARAQPAQSEVGPGITLRIVHKSRPPIDVTPVKVIDAGDRD